MQAKWMIGTAVASVMAVAGLAVAKMEAPAASGGANPDVLLERIIPGTVIEQYVAQVVAPLRSADRDNNGLDRGDVALARELQAAQMRASGIGQVLRQDLDGDFKVTRAELERAGRGDEEYRGRNVESTLEQYDADGDEVITLAEAASGHPEARLDGQLDALLKLDPSGDGVLTAEELRKLAERAFSNVDTNNDGRISAEEHRAIADKIREIQAIRYAPLCEMPPLPKGAKLLAYGGYEGDSISSVSIGGQDQETNLIEVAIEPGTTPLYLVLTSYESMVWKLTGATNRVSNVVVSSSTAVRTRPAGARPADDSRAIAIQPAGRGATSASGVTGVPARKVTITEPDCPRYFGSGEAGANKMPNAVLLRTLGREPDGTFSRYSAQRVSLPSGQITEAKPDTAPLPRGFEPAMWDEARRFWPGGLVQVDPRQVVARARVEPYKVLPSQMGLAQLIGAGAIQRLPNGRFRIVKPIAHFPPRMGGAHSVTLIVAKGVPMPAGSPLHSCVIAEDGGRTPPGPTCRGND